MQSEYCCPGCKKQVGQFSIKKHILNCKTYEPFTFNKMKRHNTSDNTAYLKFLSEQLLLAREHLEKVLQMKRDPKSNIFQFGEEQIKMQSKKEKPKSKIVVQNVQFQQNMFDQANMIKCLFCKCNFYTSFDIDRLCYIQECWQLFCKKCVSKYVQKEFINSFGDLKCPDPKCQSRIPQQQIKQILGERFDDMYNKAMRKMCNVVQCVKCKSEYDFVAGNPNDAPKKDELGKLLKPESAILYAENRFLCPSCKTQQCKECQIIPFHLGMTCIQSKNQALMMKCRFCATPITQKNINKSNISAHSDICSAKDCQQLAKTACTKMLGCSHPCSGVKNQKVCLPCLREGCCEKNQELNGQTGDDYCAICYVEALSASPSIRSGCGHIFHLKCIKKRLQIKWLTPRILFKFCHCPLCNKWIQVPQENQLYSPFAKMRELYEKIQKMAFERLKFEELLKDEKLTNKSSPYYNKPNEYAVAIYAYFECFKCKNPYFGGRKSCAEVMNAEQNVEGFDAKQLVCPNCCEIPIQNCPKHGKDFIEFKCKYCCSTAQWFCWGNTHFCQPCHKRQCSGDYVSKYTKDKLPVCPGPEKCPIGGNHEGNGQQRMLGCAICRNYKQNNKGF